MASHSFGMHENPFTPGLTLSADETVRLLQSRVSASGGDGERVFPAEACLEVHRWAGGDPVAVWSLAAAAMQRAADAGSEAVTAEHVRAAAGPTNENEPTASPEPAGSPGVGEYPAADPQAEPPVPTEGLSHLDPSARAWVARFLGSPDARRPAAQAPTIQQIASAHRQGAAWTGGERTWALPDEGRPARGLPRRRRRGARVLGAQAMAVATPLLIVAAILLYLYQRRDQLLPKPDVASLAGLQTSDSTITVPAASEPSPETPLEPSHSQASEPFQARPVPVPVLAPAPWPPGAPKPPPETAAATTPTAPAVATSPERQDSTRRAPPVRRVGIEVANFIVESRALAERDRLAATGLTVRVRTRWEAGTPIYRVVIGSYGSHREAERVADSLLARGVVREARFMKLPIRN
jgi:sporulation related protein